MAKSKFMVTIDDSQEAFLRDHGMGSLSHGIFAICKAQMDGNLNVQQSSATAMPAKPKAKGGSGYQRETAEEKEERIAAEKRKNREANYAKYSREVLQAQQDEYCNWTHYQGKIATTYNTFEEWLRHGTNHPKISHPMADWPERQDLAVRHPDLTDEMIAAAIQRGNDSRAAFAESVRVRETALRASKVSTVRPGYPVQLRKVGEFALTNLGLAKTPEEWTDDMVDIVVELDFHGGAEFKAWKEANAEMLAEMREKYRLGGAQ